MQMKRNQSAMDLSTETGNKRDTGTDAGTDAGTDIKTDKAIATWAPESEGAARNEILRSAPGLKWIERLGEGVHLILVPGGFPALARAFAQSPPIFVRHICPAEKAVPVDGSAEDLDRLAAAAESFRARVLQPFSVQSRILTPVHTGNSGARAPGARVYGRFEINERLAAVLAAGGAPIDVRQPVQVLSVVVAGGRAYLGLSRARENLSGWAGGERRLARRPGQISRAAFKLEEACEAFGLRLPPRGKALDLGAAPGGWTQWLRSRGLEVVAVDPAVLHPSLAADPGVRHVKRPAQAFFPAKERFDVIVNDMRMDAQASAALMNEAAAALNPGGWAVVTLKLPQRRPAAAARSALERLKARYELIGARQLFHNRSEVTAALRLPSPSNPSGAGDG